MSDFEKNENELEPNEISETPGTDEALQENESAGVSQAEASENEGSDELNEELENIRSKFQEVLDETTQTYLAGGDIQGYEDEEADEPEELSQEEKCTCCGEKRRDTSFGEDYPYCSECRELMQHTPLSFKGIIALLFVLILTGVSVYFFAGTNAELATKALEAELYVSQGKVYSALEAYSGILQPFQTSQSAIKPVFPKKVAAKYAAAYASLTNYNYASSVVEQFFSEEDLKNPIYKSLKDYNRLNDCYTKIMETVNTALQDDSNDKEKICALLDELRSDENADDFLIDYYQYIVIQYMGETAENQYDILTELTEKYPDKWPLRYELCAVCSKLGKTQEAEQCLKEVVKHNSEDGAIYAYLADAYRFGEEPDTEKMLEAVENGFAADGDAGYTVTDLNRVKAVAYLLNGDYDSAYDAAAQAYQTASQSLYYGYSINNLSQCLYTFQLCAHLKGDKDAYNAVSEMFGYVGLTESDDIKSFIKGKTTLEKILTDKDGDLA